MQRGKSWALAPLAALAVPAQAADWVMLQAVEPPNVTHRFFGAVQVAYVDNFGCDRMQGLANPATGSTATAHGLNNGSYNNNCRVGPEFHNDKSDLNVGNLAFGARGNIVPGRINYFVLANAGQNFATYQPLNTSRNRLIALTDASLTLSYVPYARLRVGLMKKPGPEELYQAIDAIDYIFPTDFTARVQLEKFVETNAKGTAPIAGQGYKPSFTAYDADNGRDWGVQVFDALKSGKWTYTYAAMLGNGNGIHQDDNNGDKDLNLYLAAEYDLPGGQGPRKHGVKLYAYHQRGERNFIADATGALSRDFDLIRQGVGVRALGELFGEGRGRHRLGFDLMYADGMVFYTPTANVSDAPFGGQIQIAAERGNKARGVTLDYGYYWNKNWQFDVRYSRNDLLYAQAGANWRPEDERIIKHLTLGVNYYFTPRTRLTFNVEPRDVKAPNAVASLPPAPAARATSNSRIVVDAVGARAGVQLTHVF